MKEKTRNQIAHLGEIVLSIVKWSVIGILLGVIVGGISTAFSFCLSKVTWLRTEYRWIVYLLPLGGIVIVGLYRLLNMQDDKGTNTILDSIDKDADVPVKMAPLIFVSTVITHLFGGSAGREGAALQLGGSLGNLFGRIFKFDKKDIKIFIMTGMSAAFAALFGTPMAAAIFSIESATVGIMYFSSLLPCVLSALVASNFSATMGISSESFPLSYVPEMTIGSGCKVVLLAVLCGLMSVVFCLAMKYVKKYLVKFFGNPFLRIVVVALVFVGITALFGGDDFYGAGIEVIDRAVLEGEAEWYLFIVKTILTALILGAGFKGGEIVPAFFVGATLGCTIGHILGISPSLCAAMGMTAMFCGITNCPISAMLISFELFGFECVPYILITTAISFVCSGYFGIYSSQNIMFSKYKHLTRRKSDD